MSVEWIKVLTYDAGPNIVTKSSLINDLSLRMKAPSVSTTVSLF